MSVSKQPTVFHVTHWKAGSQWVYGILEACAPERIVKPMVKVAHFFEAPIVPGKIYPTVYAARNRFRSVLWPEGKPAVVEDARTFVVIRDLRDTMISLYFSLKISHPLISKAIEEGHRKLNELKTEEEGLMYIINERGQASANIQRSWLRAPASEALFLRYEDLIADEQGGFAKIVEHCQIDIAPSRLAQVVNDNSFKNRAGRKPGEEDITSHYRKGVSGDWKNHFTDKIKQAFKEKFGQVLIDTGYEKDLNW